MNFFLETYNLNALFLGCIGNIVHSDPSAHQRKDSAISRSRKKIRIGLIAALPLLAAAVFYQSFSGHNLSKTVDLQIRSDSVAQSTVVFEQELETTIKHPKFEYTVQKGDSLSEIFEQLGFSYRELMSIMETDLDYLLLDTIRPGDELRFWQDDDNKSLLKMELSLNIAEKAVYQRLDDGSYEFKDISIPGDWKTQALIGEIHGSFSSSANKQGLSAREIDQVVTLLKDKLSFTRDLRASDRFEVVKTKQFVEGIATGNSELQAIKIYNRGKVYSAFLHTDGQYYDADGNSLQRAFQRYPVSRNYRISSNFNPRRLHPVTKRVSPHNGTDFATPTGTSVYTTGDGVVSMVRNHPYAGKYIVVDHGGPYKTRYLHLSKTLVKKGQKVSRGQRIGLSGATGRVTGPHLHYELISRGRPVNAMKANIPMAQSVPKKELNQFFARRDEWESLLKNEELKLAKR
jgi:murein DD-endopeptidase MepM/ murein hydrolase activator NlpD